MRLTALEIQQQTFTTRFRGYDSAEVTDFLEIVRREIEVIVREREALKARVIELKDENEALRGQQAELHQCLKAGRESAEALLEQARQDATRMRRDAEQERARLVASARAEVAALERQRAELRTAIQAVLDAHTRLLSASEPPARSQDLPALDLLGEVGELRLDGLEGQGG